MGSSTSETGRSNEAPPPDDLIGVLEQGRRQFLALVEHVRPELHRYCTRMTGSAADGEDVVQETLARAYYELSQLQGDAAAAAVALPHRPQPGDRPLAARAPAQQPSRSRPPPRSPARRRSSPTTRSPASRRCEAALG